MKVIDLELYTADGKVRNLSGKSRGLDARSEFRLDDVDRGKEAVTVRIPSYVYAISTSFFCGMFSDSYTHFGSAEGFLGRYKFEVTDVQWRQIQQGIERCSYGFTSLVSAQR